MSVLTIQFITDERLMIPGTGSVGVRGQLLEIGPGRAGANFRYRSPREQIRHYGKQHYVLLTAVDDDGEPEDHPDLEVNMTGGPAILDEADDEPTGTHEVLKKLSMDPDANKSSDEEDEEEEEKAATKKTSTKRAAAKSGAKKTKKKK